MTATAFLDGAGACGELIARFDWARTPLGPVESWPASLRATVANMLHTKQPMLLFWGPELIQFYNDSFVPSFGRGKHPTAMGQCARECWADAWPVVGAQIEAVMTRGEPAWFENALVPIYRNGRMEEVFWTYSYSPAFDDRGAIHGTLVIVTEMTGRVLAARRLEALAALSASLSSLTTYEEVFAELQRITATVPADVPFLLIDAEQTAEAVRGATREPAEFTLAAGMPGPVWPEPVQRVVACTVGSHANVLVFGLSPRLPYDEGYRSFLAQVIEQVASTLRRIDARATLLDAIRMKDEFLAMLGHELRNPLAPIVSALELMNQKDTSPGQERAVIERQVRHVVRLVDDLLDVSRITRGLITLELRIVDLAEVVAASLEACTPLIEQRGHRVAVEIERDVTVRGDEARLVQIVSNLLTNAARYTSNGGEIQVALVSERDQAVLRVADNGAGIDPELLPRVFDLFVQGTRNPDRAEGGLGLGLAIVKNLITLHGGSVAVHSDGIGKGSMFEIRLARADREAAAPPIAAKRSAVPGAPKRVLVVDDNEDAANLLGEIVRMHGHDVEIVHTPERALELAGAACPEIAVLDIGLPRMDGYELASRLRVACPGCRLIALTGYGQLKDRERAFAAGFSDHLVKPVKVGQLLELITRD